MNLLQVPAIVIVGVAVVLVALIIWDVAWAIFKAVVDARIYYRTHPERTPPNTLLARIALHGAQRPPVERRPW